LLVRGLLWGGPSPKATDPSHRINSTRGVVQLSGRVLADGRRFEQGCSALLAVDRIDADRHPGRTELQLNPCPELPLQGWRVQARGRLRSPSPGLHPLLPGPAERLASRGSWSQLRVSSVLVLDRPWTPLADIRRTIAQRLQSTAGPDRGGLLAALVLGSAQVQLPVELRTAFRVAGLSHALAASGFHLSVLLGAALAVGRGLPRSIRLALAALALMLFLVLAGAQPSVVRAVLMGGIALLIRESGERSRGFGVLLLTLCLMLLVHPAWARSIGFQLSAAATAGLVLTAPGLEAWFAACLPKRLGWLAAALSVPMAAMAWTLPLQLFHFGSAPLYSLVANLLAAPVLAPLTLAAMASALLSLLLPAALLQPLLWPVAQLAGVLIALITWISHWPAARLLTGHPQPWVVALLLLGLLPWLLPVIGRWRRLALVPGLLAVLVQASVQLADGVVTVQQSGRHWLLARHRGRAALVGTAADAASCRVASRLADVHGHPRLDWVMLLDPVAPDTLDCWRFLAGHVAAPHQGHAALAMGQRLTSAGLTLELLADRGQPMLLRVGDQRWRLLPRPQALWAMQGQQQLHRAAGFHGTWLGFKPSWRQRRWLNQGRATAGL
jgi:competence protein ComEC